MSRWAASPRAFGSTGLNGVTSEREEEENDRRPRSSQLHQNLWRGVLLAIILGATFGFAAGYHYAMRRVDVLDKVSGEVLVDHHVAWGVRACAMGCRTEEDVVMEKAIKMMRGR